MKVIFSGLTDKGLVRPNNEDSFLIDEKINLFVVADGAGGLSSGEVASRIATDVIKENMERYISGGKMSVWKDYKGFKDDTDALISSIRIANQIIYETAKRNSNGNMATTCVAVFVGKRSFSYCNVGDSRIYLLRNGNLRQLTEDHSLVMEQVRQGIITKEEAEKSEIKNILTRALGIEENIEIDSGELPFKNNDVLLLCSDGLTRMLADEIIKNILIKNLEDKENLDNACRELVETANKSGGKDNITVVLVKIIDDKWNILSKIKKIFKQN